MKKNKFSKKKNKLEDIEDTTKYGEFVSSYFAWMTLSEQKENAKEMEEMTRDKNN